MAVLFVIVLAYNVPPYVGSDQPGWELHNTIGQLLLVLLILALSDQLTENSQRQAT